MHLLWYYSDVRLKEIILSTALFIGGGVGGYALNEAVTDEPPTKEPEGFDLQIGEIILGGSCLSSGQDTHLNIENVGDPANLDFAPVKSDSTIHITLYQRDGTLRIDCSS